MTRNLRRSIFASNKLKLQLLPVRAITALRHILCVTAYSSIIVYFHTCRAHSFDREEISPNQPCISRRPTTMHPSHAFRRRMSIGVSTVNGEHTTHQTRTRHILYYFIHVESSPLGTPASTSPPVYQNTLATLYVRNVHTRISPSSDYSTSPRTSTACGHLSYSTKSHVNKQTGTAFIMQTHPHNSRLPTNTEIHVIVCVDTTRE